MLVHESQILQVTIFGTLQRNLNSLNFSLLLPDVLTIADEVDAQLTQSLESYIKLMQKSPAAWRWFELVKPVQYFCHFPGLPGGFMVTGALAPSNPGTRKCGI
jgi:hypothetical protein